MKKLRLLLVMLLIAAMGSASFAQSVGELDRFENESIERRNEVKLFPNPTIDYLSIRIVNSNLDDVKFTVHNIIGNTMEVKIEKIDDNNFKVNVEDLPSGYYLLAIKDDKTQFRETYKFLKR